MALFPLLSLTVSAQVDLNKAFNEGMNAYKAKNWNVAIEHLSSIVKAKPNDAGANILYTLGFAYYFNLNYDKSAETFAAYLKKYPDTENTAEVHLILGRSLLQLEGKADEALAHLAKAAEKPEFAEEARFMAADAYIKKGDIDKAAQTLKNAMAGKSSGLSLLRAAIQLVDLYIESGKLPDAIKMLQDLERNPGYPDVIVVVNNRFVKIGDLQLEAKAYSDALEAYSNARPRNQVISIQVDRLDEMRKRKEALDKQIAAATKDKKPLARNTEERAATLTGMIENTEKVLGELRTMDTYDATIQYRIGRCYFNMERFWPSSVAFEVVADENPKSEDASTALFGAMISQWRLGRLDASGVLAKRYLDNHPQGRQFETVAELNATLLMQSGKFDEAISFLSSFIEKNPNAPIRQKMMTLLANSRFQAGQYDQAATDYDTLIKEFGGAPEFEEYVYRRTLCDFLRNKYKETVAGFDSYEKNFPSGDFLADIRYRRGIIQLALKDYDTLIPSMKALLEDTAAQGFLGQIHTLLGDAYQNRGQDNDLEASGTHFKKAVELAAGDRSVLEYALEQATNILRGARRWDDLEALWKKFLKDNPDHPMALRGVSELSKLLTRANKKEEARKMLAEYILKDIQNPRSEYVEMLISQLAGMHVPPRSIKKDAPKPDVEAIEAALVADLETADENKTPAYVARVLFAKSELARMMRDPVRSERSLGAIANTANSVDLGPILLSMVGQYLFDKGEYDKAVPLYERLRDAFPESSFSDAAPIGLGKIALARKEYDEAVKQFDVAIARAASDDTLKQATFGKGQALRMQKKREEAKKLFEEVVAAKNWRGLEKAGALYELGEIEAEGTDKGAAHAYFQRVYLSHGAFPQFAIKSYLRAADMLRMVGKQDEAKATLRELIRKYPDSPEAKKARTIVTD
ncbi:tetratricopeptide repeat protein [Luteolibacter arcticus]|uniref:Tetratricopeptide repeat protein n=1 Tax=Luteolibacter arcticus TaxID=1581411 RepID=A0ABT3GFI7_9BACT|nr:tetratricopeptide repeat protein [Luteolibacter arcticus]MCW1922365.1 tetratricopeptide repeat protein [Luteolibacter arcticus]